jgi:Fur family peroxide stress response transcriptional regulator
MVAGVSASHVDVCYQRRMSPERPPGRRSSRQLEVVLAAVAASGTTHPTAERIFDDVRRTLPRISLGTVYRNLQRLVDEGRIGVAQVGGRSVRYDATAEPHDHFVCRRCGRIDDVDPSPPEAGLAAAQRAGHAVTAHALVLFGDCRTCRDLP